MKTLPALTMLRLFLGLTLLLNPPLYAAAISAVDAAHGAKSLSAPLAIVHATLIDATGAPPLANATMVISNGRILAIGPFASVTIPRKATVIDKRGKYLIPGLMDANVHLDLNVDINSMIRFRDRYADIIIEGAQIALKSGQTTVFDTWGPYPDLKVARDRINSGQVIGARIFFAGNIIGLDGIASDDFLATYKTLLRPDTRDSINKRWTQGTGRELQLLTADEVGKRIAKYAAMDMDFLKYASNGHPQSEVGYLAFSQPAQNAIVKAGHDAGKTVQSHVHTVEGIQAALTAGVDILTHCDIMPKATIPPELIREMLAQGTYCSVMPVTKAYQEKTVPKPIKEWFINSWANIKNMTAAGVPLMLSTDAGITHPLPTSDDAEPKIDNRTTLGEGHFNALMGLEELGIDPMKALQMATINIAKGYKHEKDFGTLELGKYADLVILDANPLTSARNYRAINMVIKAGEVIDIQKLPTAPLISNQKIATEN